MSKKMLIVVAAVFAVLLGGCASDGYGGGYDGSGYGRGSGGGHSH